MLGMLIAAAALVVSTPARAGVWDNWGSIELANTGDEPQASGEASLTHVNRWWTEVIEWLRIDYYSGKLSVKCQNLTPGATYSTPVGTFTADRKGNGGARGQVSFTVCVDEGWWGPTVVIEPYLVDVVRLNPDGSTTLVLTETFFPPWATD